MNWITTHPFQDLIIYWVYSAAVSSMPELTASSSPLYVWLFRFLHALAGDLTGAVATRLSNILPGLLPKPEPGSSSVTTVGIVSEQHSDPKIPNNGK